MRIGCSESSYLPLLVSTWMASMMNRLCRNCRTVVHYVEYQTRIITIRNFERTSCLQFHACPSIGYSLAPTSKGYQTKGGVSHNADVNQLQSSHKTCALMLSNRFSSRFFGGKNAFFSTHGFAFVSFVQHRLSTAAFRIKGGGLPLSTTLSSSALL